MRKHLLIVILGFAIGVLFYAFHTFRERPGILEIFLNGCLGIGVSYAFHGANQFLNKVIDWKRQTGLRLLLGIVIHSILGVGLVYLGLKGYEQMYPAYSFFSIEEEMVFVKMVVLLFCVILVYNIIYFAFYSYQQYVKGQLLESKMKRRQTELQLKALKSQLSPHFLFNCLNALSTLVTKDIKSAEKFIRSLAKSYDYTLRTYQNTLVGVSEELEFVESYFFLIQTRFQEKIVLEVNLPKPILHTKIPPLTLQMLVENAVKHNVADTENELQIQITSNQGFLEVTNNITKKRKGFKSTQIGLKNIQSRYQLLVNKPIAVNDTAEEFKVKVPILS
ncbi:sensor histidine kinase [Flagellimonas meridianipacifica]|uniref:Histidine kinase n=1 Tax=Flagellimonas meridianipacifica TaxID=1080225 RepID=A0A2T0MBE3_9FLAO|nr:sensor histidine kinase [Allomuricauda pacifica]PRX54824.1 histidine kinase [Allomuricauda pacifica]